MAAFGGWRLTRAGVLFVVGIIVLAGLVTGSIFLVKNHGEAVRREQAVKIAEQNLKDDSAKSGSATTDTDKNTSTDTSSSSGTNSGASTAPSTSTSSTDTTTVANTGSSSSTSQATQLPQTGPNDLVGLGNTLAVTILALSTAFYLSSRRLGIRDDSRL